MKKESSRENFTATFIRKGSSINFNVNRILLKNVKNKEGLVIIKEVWINETKSFKELSKLKYGDEISFKANYDVIVNKSKNKEKRILSRVNNINIISSIKEDFSKVDNYNQKIESILNSILKDT